MFVFGKTLTAAVGVAALSGTLLVPSSKSYASPAPAAPAAEATDISIPAVASPAAADALAQAPAAVPARAVVVAAPEADETETETASNEVDRDLECLAKVVLHEAGNQSRAGQIAVAEVVMNRLQDSRRRFGSSICGVVLQRGQFFNVHAYRPYRDARWPRAVEIARQVREDMQDGDHDHVTNGGLFFRAHYGAPFRGRTRTATIGDHAFYR